MFAPTFPPIEDPTDPQPGNTVYAMQMTAEQFDMLISSGLVFTCCLCFCIGWLCHEMGGK